MAQEVAFAGPLSLSFWIDEDDFRVIGDDIKTFLATERCEGLYSYDFQFNEMSMSGSPYMITIGLSSWISQLDFHLWLLDHGIYSNGYKR